MSIGVPYHCGFVGGHWPAFVFLYLILNVEETKIVKIHDIIQHFLFSPGTNVIKLFLSVDYEFS